MYLQNGTRIAAVRTSLTYRQLVNSGDLSLITSESLRVALDEYERQARGHRDAENWSYAMTSGPNVKATRFAFLVSSLDDENTAVSDLMTTRLRAHLQDPEVIDSMWGTKLILDNNLYWHQQVRASVETVLDQLNSLCAVRCKNTKEVSQ